MEDQRPHCQFRRITLWVAAQDYAGISGEADPMTHLVEAVEQYTDISVLDSDSEELRLTPVGED